MDVVVKQGDARGDVGIVTLSSARHAVEVVEHLQGFRVSALLAVTWAPGCHG